MKTRKVRTAKWTNPIKEPPIASRMYWDLAKDACPCCAAGEFPLTKTADGLMHPNDMPCLAAKVHKLFKAHIANKAKLDPFRGKIILSKLKVWKPMTLAAIIRRCDDEYWRKNGAKLTLQDTDYDKVVRRLTKLAPDHPQLSVIGDASVKR